MHYNCYNRKLKKGSERKWELREIFGVGLATDENYENCCGRETIKFFRRVFHSKETTTRLTGGITRHTSQLYNEKSEHYFVPISWELYDLIKEIKNKINLKDFNNWEKSKVVEFIKNTYKVTTYYADTIQYFIELYNKQF